MVRFAHRPRKFSHPHLPSCRHARYGNGFAVLRSRSGPTGACRCAWRCVGGIGTGNIKAALRAGSKRPVARIEQGTELCTIQYVTPVPGYQRPGSLKRRPSRQVRISRKGRAINRTWLKAPCSHYQACRNTVAMPALGAGIIII